MVKIKKKVRPAPPAKVQRLASYVGGELTVDSSYVVVAFNLVYALELRSLMAIAKALAEQLGTAFYRISMFAPGVVEAGSTLGECADANGDSLMQVCEDGADWVALPEGWHWPDSAETRLETILLEVGPDDVLWHFHEKFCDAELETYTLGESKISDLIKELSAPTT